MHWTADSQLYVYQNFLVNGIPGRAFVDSGCTFNAISKPFAEKLGTQIKEYDNDVVCHIGQDQTVRMKRRIARVFFDMGALGTYDADVFVMDKVPTGAEAIFGMDFLRTVNPTIDWQQASVAVREQKQQVAYIEEEIRHHEAMYSHRYEEIYKKEPDFRTRLISPEEFEEDLKAAHPENFFFVLNPITDKETEKAQRFKSQGWEALKDNPALPVLLKYKDTVFKEELELEHISTKTDIQHEIELTTDEPFNIPQFRLSPEQQRAVGEWTEKMMKAGLIRKSTSPFNSPIFCVRKPVGWRIVHDFRFLNSRTRIPRGPIPRKDEIIDAMHNGYYFSSMDLLSGYYQMMLKEEDRHLTAFSTPSGHYEYIVTAQGLAGAPSTFNRFVQQAFAGLRDICRAFFDDVFIFTKSRSLKDHLDALERVLERCQQEGITIKLSKCVFVSAEIPVLGDFVGRDGVRVDPDKVAIITDWPVPRKASDLKSFLGTIVYCSRFLKEYGKLVAPLQKLLAGARKNDPVKLTVDQLAAFNHLKLAMVNAPVLAIADHTKPFGIRMDACDYALGGVLFQIDDQGREQPVAYTGRKFTRQELKYPVREKELLAIMHALHVWRPYLIDHGFTVETDHRSLEGILTQKQCTQRLARWLNTLSEYRPIFKWIPGDTNVVADGLSRHPAFEPTSRASQVDMRDLLRSILAEERDEKVEVAGADVPIALHFMGADVAELFCYVMSERDIVAACQAGYPEDPEFAELWQIFKDGVDQQDDFKFHEGLIWKKNQSEDMNEWRICIPNVEELRYKIIFSEHDALSKGHPGMYKTIAFMKRHYYWKKMTKFVQKYVGSCEKCQRNKHRQTRKPGRLNPLPVPEARWNDITMDFIVDLPESDGYNAIWVIVDRLSKRSHFIPVKMGTGESSAESCAKIFCREYVRLHGLPETIVSDRDTRFTSLFWQTLMKMLGIEQKMSSAFRPNTDGQSERVNRFIEDFLRNYVHPCQKDWNTFLYAAEFAFNSRVHESLGMSPFEADIGYVPKAMSDRQFDRVLKKSNSAAFDFGVAQQLIMERVKMNLNKAQERMKKYYDRNRPIQTFSEGDLVMISAENLDVQHLGVHGKRKLAPLWIGPYKVIKKTTPDTYKLRVPIGLRLHDEFHTSLLKPYRKDAYNGRVNKPNAGMVVAGGSEDGYLVEAIVGHKKLRGRNKGIFFLVKWLGYPDDENSWEPIQNLMKPVRHLLEDYVESKKLDKRTWLRVD